MSKSVRASRAFRTIRKSRSPRTDFDLLENFWREPITRAVLPNGLTVLIKPDHSAPVASVQVWVRTGSIHEGAHLGAGLSHFLEHMLFKGTERRAPRDISATVQAHGGLINAYTTFDRTVYHIDLPSGHAPLAIDVLADMVLHSKIPDDEFAREKDVILREIDMCRDDPDQRIAEKLFDTAFRRHPFKYPIIGYKDVFAAVTRDELLAYYRARYAPDNLVVIVAGDIEPAAALAEVEKHFSAAPRAGIAPVLIPGEPAQLAPRAAHLHEDVELTRAALSWPAPGIAHPDAPLLDLLATILGAGDSSILWQGVREKARLVHTIDAQSWTPGDTGLFSIAFTADPEKRDAAIAAIHAVLAKCAKKGFTTAQIKKAVRQLIVGEINSRKTMSGQAARLGASEVIVGDLDYARMYFQRLRRVTPAGLRRVLNAWLVPGRLTVVSSNPAQKNAAGPASAARAAAVPQFEEIRLPNGARLLLHHDARLPSLHMRVLCQGGALYETPGKRGATALLGTMLAKDTRRRSAAQVAQAIEEIGGVLHPSSGNNSIGLAVEVLSGEADIARGLELLGDAVYTPAFKRETFETERDAQLAALALDADDVVTRGRKILRKKFFGAYPLSHDASGDEQGVRALAPADLAALWKKLFTAENTVLAVAGDFDRAKLLPKLKAFLARVPAGSRAAPDAAPFGSTAQIGDFTESQSGEQAIVYQAFPGPGLLAPDFYAGEVADELFSGMSSRLFERVREEKGLAYFVRSSRVTGIDAGMFAFFAGTSPAHYAEVLREIDAEIARVQAGDIGAGELGRCRVRLKAARRMSLQTNASRAMQAGLNAIYGQPVNDWLNYDRHIDAVTAETLRDFAKKYFQRSQRTQLVVKP